MKNIFITYDRYERDEWYHVYHLCTNEEKARAYFKEHALIDFLNYGPDDCHAFQLQRVLMSDYKYRKLRALVKADDKEEELRQFLLGIYRETDYEVETIYSTDGCSDNFEIVKLYCAHNNLNYENFEDADAAYDALADDEVFAKYAHIYISSEY